MKIEDLLAIAATPKLQEAKPAGGANFAQHLEEALAADSQKTAASQAAGKVAPTSAVDPLAEISRNPSEVLDKVLTRLDTYREALAQSDLPLKKLSTLVQMLETDSQRLQTLAQSLPGNSPLKQVMEEAAALAYTESFKFNRGDYV
jgi:hypothetical protein